MEEKVNKREGGYTFKGEEENLFRNGFDADPKNQYVGGGFKG